MLCSTFMHVTLRPVRSISSLPFPFQSISALYEKLPSLEAVTSLFYSSPAPAAAAAAVMGWRVRRIDQWLAFIDFDSPDAIDRGVACQPDHRMTTRPSNNNSKQDWALVLAGLSLGMGLVFGGLFLSAGKDPRLQGRVLTATNVWLVLSGVIHVRFVVCVGGGWFGSWVPSACMHVCVYVRVPCLYKPTNCHSDDGRHPNKSTIPLLPHPAQLWIEGSFVFARDTSVIKPGLDYYAAGDLRYGSPMEVRGHMRVCRRLGCDRRWMGGRVVIIDGCRLVA